MNDTERLLAERACERLVAEYCLRVDEVLEGRVADIFTEDGYVENDGHRMEGREGLLRMPRGSERGFIMRHISSCVVIDVIDEDHARGTSYFTAFVEPGGSKFYDAPFAVGEYHDEFRRTPDGWRFASRIITTAMRRRGAEAPR